jgi:predicted DNA-binding protein
MRSVRFDTELEERLKQVSELTGKPASEVIRTAVREHCEIVLGNRLDRRLADVVGSIASRGGSSRKSGRQFTEILKSRRKRKT